MSPHVPLVCTSSYEMALGLQIPLAQETLLVPFTPKAMQPSSRQGILVSKSLLQLEDYVGTLAFCEIIFVDI